MKFKKRGFGEFQNFIRNYHECKILLSYDTLERNFIAFKMNTMSIRKRIVDTDVADDVTCTCQYVFIRVIIRFL